MATVFRHKGKERLLERRCGTLPYIAPEVLMRPQYNAEPADVWSCGMVLLAMLTGGKEMLLFLHAFVLVQTRIQLFLHVHSTCTYSGACDDSCRFLCSDIFLTLCNMFARFLPS